MTMQSAITAAAHRPITKLLDRLDGLKERGPDAWLAKCPAHDDRNPSLSIRETSDGTVLLKCWTGCTAAEVVAAVGPGAGRPVPAHRSTPQGEVPRPTSTRTAPMLSYFFDGKRSS
jgi:hypothetical protein